MVADARNLNISSILNAQSNTNYTGISLMDADKIEVLKKEKELLEKAERRLRFEIEEERKLQAAKNPESCSDISNNTSRSMTDSTNGNSSRECLKSVSSLADIQNQKVEQGNTASVNENNVVDGITNKTSHSGENSKSSSTGPSTNSLSLNQDSTNKTITSSSSGTGIRKRVRVPEIPRPGVYKMLPKIPKITRNVVNTDAEDDKKETESPNNTNNLARNEIFGGNQRGRWNLNSRGNARPTFRSIFKSPAFNNNEGRNGFSDQNANNYPEGYVARGMLRRQLRMAPLEMRGGPLRKKMRIYPNPEFEENRSMGGPRPPMGPPPPPPPHNRNFRFEQPERSNWNNLRRMPPHHDQRPKFVRYPNDAKPDKNLRLVRGGKSGLKINLAEGSKAGLIRKKKMGLNFGHNRDDDNNGLIHLDALPVSESGVGTSFSRSGPPEIPPTDSNLLIVTEQNETTFTNVYNEMRAIRFYGKTAVTFLSPDDPREICFRDDTCNLIVLDKCAIPLEFNAPDKEAVIDGAVYRIRIGAPTRELYVNGIGHKCPFNSLPVLINFGLKTYNVRLEGNPIVDIKNVKRLDLVAGIIKVVIDFNNTFSVYLDSQLQRIEIDGIPLILQFADNLETVLLNDCRLIPNYGGAAQPISVFGKIHHFQLTSLPNNIRPGYVNIENMVRTKSAPNISYNMSCNNDLPEYYTNTISNQIPCADVKPVLPELATSKINNSDFKMSSFEESSSSSTGLIPSLDMNINELYQKLVQTGIVGNTKNENSFSEPDFSNPKSLKQKHRASIIKLHEGIQCGSCGIRFPVEYAEKYHQHLDWHFRQNRKSTPNTRNIRSRKYYHKISDWIQFEEIEDEKAQCWFECTQVGAAETKAEENLPSVPIKTDADNVCNLCKERFEQFFDDETDEWHLKNCIRILDKVYHPICYDGGKETTQVIDVEDIIDLDESEIEEPSSEIEEPEISTDENLKSDILERHEEKIFGPEKSSASQSDQRIGSSESIQGNGGEGDDDDIQLIEQPVEEIVINDDVEEELELNMETINKEELAAEQLELEKRSHEEPLPISDSKTKSLDINNEQIDITIPTKESDFISESIDITESNSEPTLSMDGNSEIGNNQKDLIVNSNKIKINIAHPSLSPTTVELIEDDSEDICILEEVPAALKKEPNPVRRVIAELKPRLSKSNLKVCPTVSKGKDYSGLCSIM